MNFERIGALRPAFPLEALRPMLLGLVIEVVGAKRQRFDNKRYCGIWDTRESSLRLEAPQAARLLSRKSY